MKKGLTLAELLVSMAIFTIVTGAIFSIVNMGYATSSKNRTSMDLMQVRNGMDRLLRETRASSSAAVTTINTTNDTLTFSSPPFAVNVKYCRNTNNQLIRQNPAASGCPTVISGSERVIAGNIAFLQFTLNAPSLLVQMRADKTVSGKTYSFPLKERVRLRNE